VASPLHCAEPAFPRSERPPKAWATPQNDSFQSLFTAATHCLPENLALLSFPGRPSKLVANHRALPVKANASGCCKCGAQRVSIFNLTHRPSLSSPNPFFSPSQSFAFSPLLLAFLESAPSSPVTVLSYRLASGLSRPISLVSVVNSTRRYFRGPPVAADSTRPPKNADLTLLAVLRCASPATVTRPTRSPIPTMRSDSSDDDVPLARPSHGTSIYQLQLAST